MVSLPKEFVATKYPGYFFNLKDKKLYSLKIDGILKPLTFIKPNIYNKLNPFETKGGWRVSVRGTHRWLVIEYLESLKPTDSEIPVK